MRSFGRRARGGAFPSRAAGGGAGDGDRRARGRRSRSSPGPATSSAARPTPNFDWVTKFEEATGCKVEVKTANTSDEMVALMNEGGFDLVTASGDASLRLVAGGRVQPINVDLDPVLEHGRRPAEGRALAHRRRRALRRALHVGPERADVQHRGLQGAADLLERRLRGADPARRPVEQGPGAGLRRPDPHRRRRAVPDGAQARARHHLALRADPGAVRRRARPAAPAAPARRPLLARRLHPDRRLQERGRRRLRLLAVPGQPAEVREPAGRQRRSPRRAPPAGPTPR